MSSPVPTTDPPLRDDGRISPKLGLTVAGCILLFIFILVGFQLVARRTCCTPRAPRLPRSSHSDTSLPSYHDPHHYDVRPPPPARSRFGSRCPLKSLDCLKRAGEDNNVPPCVSPESPFPPPPPYPEAARTPPIRTPPTRSRGFAMSWWARSGSATSFDRRPDDASLAHPVPAPVTATTPPLPPFPPPAYYASRGPVARLPPHYRRS